MHNNMVFHSADQKLAGPFAQTVAKVKGGFYTGTVKGTKPASRLVYTVPYDGGWHPSRPHPPAAGKVLSGESLKQQAAKWAAVRRPATLLPCYPATLSGDSLRQQAAKWAAVRRPQRSAFCAPGAWRPQQGAG